MLKSVDDRIMEYMLRLYVPVTKKEKKSQDNKCKDFC